MAQKEVIWSDEAEMQFRFILEFYNKRTRVINLDVFLIFYDIFEKFISIVSFWYNRQNPEKRIDN